MLQLKASVQCWSDVGMSTSTFRPTPTWAQRILAIWVKHAKNNIISSHFVLLFCMLHMSHVNSCPKQKVCAAIYFCLSKLLLD